MVGLQGFQLPVEAVVLGVGDLRRVIDVVAAVVVADLLAQILYPAPNVHASGHARIIRKVAPAPKRREPISSLPPAEHAAGGSERGAKPARAVLGLDYATGGGDGERSVRGFEVGEELVYLVADDLFSLQEGVADAFDHGALLAQEGFYLLAGPRQNSVRLLAHLSVAQQGAYRGACHLVGERTEGVEPLAHPEQADHRRRRPGRLLQIPAHARRGLAEVDVLGRPRRERRLDAGHHIRAGADVALLPLLVADEPEGVLPLDNRDDLHLELLALQIPGGDSVAGLVGGDLHLLLLVVLDGLLQADLIRQLRRPDVLPAQRVPAVLEGEDQGLVYDVLDPGRRVADRRLRQLLQVYLFVLDFLEVVVGYVHPALLVGKTYVQAPVEAPGSQEGGVEGVGLVGGPDNKYVVGRRLPLEVAADEERDHTPQETPEASWLLQAVHLHQELVDEHPAHAHPAQPHASHDPVHEAAGPPRRLLGTMVEPLFEPVAEGLVEGVRFHGLGDAAAGSYSVELVHEDHGPTVALRELTRLGEQAHDLEVAYPHEHAGKARCRGVDKGHVHLAG